MGTNQPLDELISGGAPNASLPQNAMERLAEPNGSSSFEQSLLRALRAMRLGDFTVRLTDDRIGLPGKIADTFNDIVAANQQMVQQLKHVGNIVGREGKTRRRAKFGLSHGAWGEMETSVNTLSDDLLWPTAAVTRAIAAVAKGDLTETVPSTCMDGPSRANSCGQQKLSTP
jgi:hypothetical protein